MLDLGLMGVVSAERLTSAGVCVSSEGRSYALAGLVELEEGSDSAGRA